MVRSKSHANVQTCKQTNVKNMSKQTADATLTRTIIITIDFAFQYNTKTGNPPHKVGFFIVALEQSRSDVLRNSTTHTMSHRASNVHCQSDDTLTTKQRHTHAFKP